MNERTRKLRRQFLQTAGLGAVAFAAGQVSADDDPADGSYVDAHSHIWTPDVDAFPLAGGATKADLKPPSFTTEQLLQVARPAGVERVVLIQHHTYYGYDNSYMIDAARRYPGVFRIVGMVDDQTSHPDRRMRTLLKQGVTGFRITPWIRKSKWLDGTGMASMWKCGAETRQAMCCLLDPPYLESVDRMCTRFPETPVVIDHMGRIGVDGQVRQADIDQLCRLARHRQTHVKISAFYALGKKQPPYTDLIPLIRRLRDAFGARRLMWASDCPYQLEGPHTYQASLDLVRRRLDFLAPQELVYLLRKTAEKVYYFS